MKSIKDTLFSQFFALNFFHMLNDGYVGSMLLFLPFIAKDLHLNLTEVGALATIIKSASIFLAIPAGLLATRIGGFRAILLAALIYSLGFFGVGFSSGYLLLLFLYLLGGIGYGIFHPIAFSLIARWTPKERRGRAMGNFMATGDVGKIGVSALLTIVLAAIGWRNTAFIYAAVAFSVIGLYYLFFLKKQDTKTVIGNEKKTSVSISDILKHKRFLLANLTCVVDDFASSAVYIFLPFLLLKRSVTPAALGLFISAFFVGNLLGKMIFGKMSDRFGMTRLFIMAEIGMAVLIFILANSHILPIIFLCSMLLGFFTTGTAPITQTMVLESAEHHGNFEKAFGLNSTINNTASTAAPLILGIISDHFSISIAFDVMAAAALLAIIPALGFHKTKHKAIPVIIP